MVAPPKSKLDANQVLQHAFNEADGRLRVDAAISLGPSSTAVVIDHTDDSIRLGDGTNFLTSTTVGSDIGLDVNIIHSVLPDGASTEAKQDVGNTSLASIDSKLVNDYGSSANAVRTASQIGNTTGEADFDAGISGAQTLRTSSNITRNGTELSYNDGSSDVNTLRVSSNVKFDGTTPSLTAGATDANTQRISANITRNGNELDYNIGTPSANTIRSASILSNSTGQIDYNHGIVGAQTPRITAVLSNETAKADFNAGVTGAQTLRTVSNLNDGSANAITSQTNGAQRALDVGINVSGIQIDPRMASPGTLTDRSGTATSTSTQIMAANSSRKYLLIQNSANFSIWIDFTTTAVAAPPSIEISAGDTFKMEGSFISTEAINVIRGGGVNTTYTAKEG